MIRITHQDISPGYVEIGAGLVSDNGRIGRIIALISKTMVAIKELIFPFSTIDACLPMLTPAGEYLKGTAILSDIHVWCDLTPEGGWKFLQGSGHHATKFGSTIATHFGDMLDTISLLAAVKLLDIVKMGDALAKIPLIDRVAEIGLKLGKVYCALVSGIFGLADSILLALKKWNVLFKKDQHVSISQVVDNKLLLNMTISAMKITIAAMSIFALNLHPAFLILGVGYSGMQVYKELLSVEATLKSDAILVYQNKKLTQKIPVMTISI